MCLSTLDASRIRIQHEMAGDSAENRAQGGPTGAREAELATVILDTLGKVLSGNSAATRLFCDSTKPLSGRNIRALIPDFPFRPITPGYNLAYATFWAAEGGWRQFNARDSRRHLFRLDVALDKHELASRREIVLRLRPVRESAPVQLQWRFSEQRVPAHNTAASPSASACRT